MPPPPPPRAVEPEPHSCYRHRDRPTGRRCTRCGNYACSDCLVQAAVGSHCVDCAKAGRPNAATRARHWNARQPTLVTTSIIAANVAVFVWGAILDPATIGGRIRLGGIHADFALNRRILEFTDEWYRLATSGFLHFGILHLAFNMYMLWMLGQMLEPALGRVRFALLYAAGLLGGSLGVLLLDQGLTAGASGAVFGLLGAAFVGQWRRGANPLTTSIGSVLMMNLFITFAWRDQISVGGHLGGVIAGAICGWVMLAPPQRRIRVELTYAVPLLVAVAAVAASVAVAS